MAIYVSTDNPQDLLDKIKDYINKGKIDTWSFDSEGDFTHCADQWKNKAWFRPKIVGEYLVFGILGNTEVTMTKQLYGLYHGRFIEMVLSHFDSNMKSLKPTVMKSKYDSFS